MKSSSIIQLWPKWWSNHISYDNLESRKYQPEMLIWGKGAKEVASSHKRATIDCMPGMMCPTWISNNFRKKPFSNNRKNKSVRSFWDIPEDFLTSLKLWKGFGLFPQLVLTFFARFLANQNESFTITDGPMDQLTDTPSYREAWTHLKTVSWQYGVVQFLSLYS